MSTTPKSGTTVLVAEDDRAIRFSLACALKAEGYRVIEAGDGKAVLATMGGGTVTATREGDAIVLTDSAGNKAKVAQADQRFTNGVVHQIDGVLMPSGGTGGAAAAPAAAPAG